MVQLTRPAAARLSPVLARHGKAGDLMGKPGYGRKAIQVGAVPVFCTYCQSRLMLEALQAPLADSRQN